MGGKSHRAGVTLVEMLVIAGVMAFALLGTLKAVTVARGLSDRGDVLTRLMLRAHSEIEAKKALPFDRLEIGATRLTGFADPNTTGVLTISKLPDSAGLKIGVELASRTWRGAERIELSALRFPEAKP